jgi:hypothetical protein
VSDPVSGLTVVVVAGTVVAGAAVVAEDVLLPLQPAATSPSETAAIPIRRSGLFIYSLTVPRSSVD